MFVVIAITKSVLTTQRYTREWCVCGRPIRPTPVSAKFTKAKIFYYSRNMQ